jgi:hypothetical protein
VKTNRRLSWFVLAAVIAMIVAAYPPQVPAQTAATKSSAGNSPSGVQWTVQVDKVDAGEVNLAPSFQIAIYENLLDEMRKTKQFKEVLREGDRNAGDASDLLILKTTVEKYTPGSETRRAVTTVSGATKLTVHSQLRTRDGQTLLDRTVNGNVRFMGSNLRATRNLARNVAKTIKESRLSLSLPVPAASPSAPAQSGQL